jgi:hypothetical protein
MRSGGSGWTRAAGRVPAVLAWRTAPVPSRPAGLVTAAAVLSTARTIPAQAIAVTLVATASLPG